MAEAEAVKANGPSLFGYCAAVTTARRSPFFAFAAPLLALSLLVYWHYCCCFADNAALLLPRRCQRCSVPERGEGCHFFGASAKYGGPPDLTPYSFKAIVKSSVVKIRR